MNEDISVERRFWYFLSSFIRVFVVPGILPTLCFLALSIMALLLSEEFFFLRLNLQPEALLYIIWFAYRLH